MAYDAKRVAAAFQRLIATFPRFESGDAATALRVYYEVTSQFDTEDIEETVNAFINGMVPGQSLTFLPPAPMFVSQVRSRRDKRIDRIAEHRAAVKQIEEREVVKEGTPETRFQRMQAIIAESPLFADEQAHKSPEVLARELAERTEYLRKHDELLGPDMSDDAVRRRLHLNVERSGQ